MGHLRPHRIIASEPQLLCSRSARHDGARDLSAGPPSWREARSGSGQGEDEQRAGRGGDRPALRVEHLALGERDPAAGLDDPADRGQRPRCGGAPAAGSSPSAPSTCRRPPPAASCARRWGDGRQRGARPPSRRRSGCRRTGRECGPNSTPPSSRARISNCMSPAKGGGGGSASRTASRFSSPGPLARTRGGDHRVVPGDQCGTAVAPLRGGRYLGNTLTVIVVLFGG